MQALPISNLPLVNVPSLASATPFSSDLDPRLPFAALFQSVMKGAWAAGTPTAGNSAKFPAAGKPQDSSREPACATSNQSDLLAGFPQALAVPACAPILFDFSELALPFIPSPAINAIVPSTPAAAPAEAAPWAAASAAPETTAGRREVAPTSSLGFEAIANLTANAIQLNAFTRDFSLAGMMPPNDSGHGPVSFLRVAGAQDVAPFSSASPAAPKGAHDSSAPASVFEAAATLQSTPIATISDSNFIPNAAGLPPIQNEPADWLPGNALPSQGNSQGDPQSDPPPAAVVPPSAPQSIHVNGPGSQVPSTAPMAKAAQQARADLNFLSMQALVPPAAATTTKASFLVSGSPAANPPAQPNSPSPVNASSTTPQAVAQSAARSAAIGAMASKFHESLQSQTASPAPPAPGGTTPFRTQPQSKDNSNGSSGNDSNTKPDRTSNVADARADEKSFVQSLDTTVANPPSAPAPAADSAVAAAAARAPVQTPSGNSEAQPQAGAPSSSASLPAHDWPAATAGAPVVSAARILEQPGQSEIRIEMQADSLGGIELRAHLAGDQIGASIAVEHHDAQLMLATELPALHNALVEKNLRVDTLSVSQGTFSSMNGGAGEESGQKNYAQSFSKSLYAGQAEAPLISQETPPEWTVPATSRAGLSVLA